jgi:hypothetical protein
MGLVTGQQPLIFLIGAAGLVLALMEPTLAVLLVDQQQHQARGLTTTLVMPGGQLFLPAKSLPTLTQEALQQLL